MASLLGAIYSVVAYMKILEIYSNIVLKILLSVIIVYIAYNPQTVKKLWKTLVMFYLVSFVFGGVAFSLIYIIKPQDINTKALIDTGNMLKEPITNTPVVVVEKILLYECIPKEILNNINQIIGGDLEKIPQQIQSQYISKLKLIPFSSLGKQNGMLLGIKVQQIKIIKESEEITKENIIVGIYQQSLTKNGEYQALMGMEFI